MGSRLIALTALVAVVTACNAASDPTSTTTTGSTLVPGTVTTTPVSDTCSREDMTEGGQVANVPNPGTDAQSLSGASWTTLPGCELFTFRFATSEGAPATTPPSIEVRYMDPAPVVRIALGVTTAVLREQLVETSLVQGMYAVRGVDGAMFVDLLLAGPAKARVDVSSSPAAITVELQPGIVDHPTGPELVDDLVLISPLDGATAGRTVAVAGYARGYEEGVVVIATSGDSVLGEHRLPPAEDGWMWTEFTTELALDPGSVNLFVGEQLPTSGLQGVSVTLTVG
jgi:hypothetical protein